MLLRYGSVKRSHAWRLGLARCYHGTVLGLHAHLGTRCYRLLWQRCR